MVFSIVEGDIQLVDKNGVPLATVSGANGPMLEVSSAISVETTISGIEGEVKVREQNLDTDGYIRNSAHNYGQYDGNWMPFALDAEGRQKLVIETVVTPHTINGAYHTGQLDDSQIPSYITRDEELNTVSGVLQDQIDNISTGITSHSVLTNLDYASAGHTGFQPAGDYVTNYDLTTTSGTLQDQLDGIVIPTDFYSRGEVDTISGSLNDKISNKANLIHTHDDHYYTETEVDTISGTLQNQIDNFEGMEIHGNAWHSTAFTTEYYVDTVSGTLQDQIDTLPPGITHHSYLDGLQGGGTNEHYHLNEPQHTNISGGNPIFTSVTATHYGDGSHLTGISGIAGGAAIHVQDDYVDKGDFSTLNFQFLKVTDEGSGVATVTYETVFGTYSAFNSSIAENTTTSNAYQQKLRTTVSGLVTGTYRLGWYCETRGNDIASDILLKIEQNDTAVLAETNIEPKDTTGYIPESGFAYVELLSNTVYNFDMDYRSETSGITTYIRRARFEFWRII